MEKQPQEVVLIGAGIMSATLSILLKKINPAIKISVFEKLDKIGFESSDAFNNAGTGHSAFCELNYTPIDKNGNVNIDKAINIAKQFETSKEFWSYLVENNYVSSPEKFLRPTPHMSFVWGEDDVNFLRKRYEKLSQHPLFKDMEYSEDFAKIKEWAPLIVNGRNESEKVAATHMNLGTDVNFGELTRQIFQGLKNKNEITLETEHEVKDLTRLSNGKWAVKVKDLKSGNNKAVNADFVFIGAGGGAILLLQKSGIPESKKFGGFPVGGQWLICQNEEVIKQHHAKVYGKAKIGAPPMSVPHLDTRVIDGKQSLLFGPFATFSTKFLKYGSNLDLFKSVNLGNVGFLMNCGLNNIDLTKYLIEQVMLSKAKKVESLQEYLPEAKLDDWFEQTAGQRVQVIEQQDGKGTLKFGTEIVTSQDGSMSALLGASPGASTSVSAMLNLMKQCFPDLMKNDWNDAIKTMIPSYGEDLGQADLIEASRARTTKVLKILE
ncbi:malate dehydrogenase (quinone) [Empedobacter stercoris]|uniref:Probable malate:quinone oxidoreductase n=1 Tax=Empedobacter falsenii TaxID=343874 RepID=A0ABY8V9X6_9FLAO|nr:MULTISPECIES: malate dehydrogenase (quinone) [Empedobacter]MCA4810438.1 malate dehydrogenase (quinone) [Empedobacter stercoris]MDM1523036.1 malate dehydrogenase (quinone) [Empedobacter sp. 225-1]QNT13348.1 malate dehydrogenase (quinone) [Empedobacter stercoris]UWX68260.1 malate dehydrogenase (quinone) [Empedobacter stercoris]WIH98421.1 malate dehydrogenase (quinone) [Empedobacter falsenii]